MVGDILDISVSGKEVTITLNKTLTSLDSGYGLQNSTAKGMDGTSQFIGVVPFSGTNYWDDGSGNLINPYNANGASYSGSPYPYVYNSTMSNIAPSLDYTEGERVAQNNGYTVAYFVEQYINTLGINGTGRLLKMEEAETLGCILTGRSAGCGLAPSWLNNGTSYCLGLAFDSDNVLCVRYDAAVVIISYGNATCGVRPVIVVSTSDIQNS